MTFFFPKIVRIYTDRSYPQADLDSYKQINYTKIIKKKGLPVKKNCPFNLVKVESIQKKHT